MHAYMYPPTHPRPHTHTPCVMKLECEVVPVLLIRGYNRLHGQWSLPGPLCTLKYNTILSPPQLTTCAQLYEEVVRERIWNHKCLKDSYSEDHPSIHTSSCILSIQMDCFQRSKLHKFLDNPLSSMIGNAEERTLNKGCLPIETIATMYMYMVVCALEGTVCAHSN